MIATLLAASARNRSGQSRRRRGPWELAIVPVLCVVPVLAPALGGTVDMASRILIWGLFGLGFDIVFGYTGLLSFGQAAFYGVGGFTAAVLLIGPLADNALLALGAGVLAAALAGLVIGALSLRRSGIYFAMLTVAFAQMFYFLANSPLSQWTGGENGLSGVPKPVLGFGAARLRIETAEAMYALVAVLFLIGFWLARRIVRSPFGAVLRAIRENPERTAAVGHDVHAYKLAAFVIGAAYAGLAGGLLGLLQGYMPPDAFSLDTSGQLVIQTVVGGAGTLIGPLVGAGIWSALRTLLQAVPQVGSLWKLGLGVVFVVLVTFLPRGVCGGILLGWRRLRGLTEPPLLPDIRPVARAVPQAANSRRGRLSPPDFGAPPLLEARALVKRYGGLTAVGGVSLAVVPGEVRALIGPNGAGKSTLFKMLAGDVAPSAGEVFYRGARITACGSTTACQFGIAKSYQINQLFPQFTVRENLLIPALARQRGRFRPDMLLGLAGLPGLWPRIDDTLEAIRLGERADMPVAALAYGEKRRLEVGLALTTGPEVLLLDEPMAGMSPAERTEMVRLVRQVAAHTTIVIVEHDMDVVFELADRITVLSEGRTIADGTAEAIRCNELVQEAYLGGAAEHEPA